MTLIKDQEYYSLYFDNVLASRSDSKGIVIKLERVYFGGDSFYAGATGA